MHELSIATSILNTVLHEMQNRNLVQVNAIVTRIGSFSTIEPDSLQFCFEAIKADTPLAKTELKIETVPLECKCRACDHEFAVESYVFTCPSCHSTQLEIVKGEELDIAYLEVEDDKN